MKSSQVLTGILFFLAGLASGQTHKNTSQEADAGRHAAWIMQGNIYEVNVRQFTREGTLNAFARHVDRLQSMGVQTLWFMPLNPISRKDRKGSLGSYYAVADYTAVNQEFGTLADWIRLVKAIHQKGMKVIIDWVPNHTGGDNRWLTEHPDFFVKDSTGQAAIAKDWSDTRQLDYSNPVMRDSMIAAMKFWIRQSDIDGFRCDVAWNVPGDFWKQCIGELRKMKTIFMLAEGEDAYLPRNGFDAIYPWRMFHMMVKVAAGERPAFALDSIKQQDDTLYPPRTIMMYFTSNHDENSWNKADYGIFPGAAHAPFAIFSQTMASGVPLIYSGQEEPVLRALAFFEKDPIGFHSYGRAAFYKKLLQLRKANPALAADAGFRKIQTGNDGAVYAYLREKNGHRALVILNLTNKEQDARLSVEPANSEVLNFFANTKEKLPASLKMKPWDYAIYLFPSGSKQ